MLAHLSAFYAPVIGPLLFYFIKRDTSRFVAFHALQALIFHFIIVAAAFISFLLSFILIGIPLAILTGIAYTVFPILAAVKALQGEWYHMPLAGGIAENAVR